MLRDIFLRVTLYAPLIAYTHYLIDELEPPVIKKDLFLSKCECGIFGNILKKALEEISLRF